MTGKQIFYMGIVLYFIYRDKISITRIKAFTPFDPSTFTRFTRFTRKINLRKEKQTRGSVLKNERTAFPRVPLLPSFKSPATQNPICSMDLKGPNQRMLSLIISEKTALHMLYVDHPACPRSNLLSMHVPLKKVRAFVIDCQDDKGQNDRLEKTL